MGGGRSAVEGTISLSEASRFGGRSTAFSLMLKPVGSRCNLRCSYCYYLDKSFLYDGCEPLMSLPLLERCIRDFCASCDLPEAHGRVARGRAPAGGHGLFPQRPGI